MTRRSSSSRVGIVAFLVLAVALIGAYLSDCLPMLGFGTGDGQRSDVPSEAASEKASSPQDAEARIVIVVQGERCRVSEGAALEACEDVCKRVEGKVAEIEATGGTHRAAEGLRKCLESRGFERVRIVSE